MKKVIFVFVTIAQLACAVYGLFYGIAWAKNITLFLVWTMTVMIALVSAVDEVKLEARKKGRSLPKWFSVTADLSIALMLASVGRFFSAAAMVLQTLCEMSIFEGGQDKDETP
jgi:hypothetical protein